jgi:hypothetical protein
MGERWKNQLGSVADLHFHHDGTVTGFYSTAVSSNGTGINDKPLRGTWQLTPEGDMLVGWVVQWVVPREDGTTRYSTTSWSGVIFKDSKRLDTTWILTVAGRPAWDRTNISKDLFELVEL